MSSLKKDLDNISKLSKGEHSLEEVLKMARVTSAVNIDMQLRTEKEFAEDHIESERYEKQNN